MCKAKNVKMVLLKKKNTLPNHMFTFILKVYNMSSKQKVVTTAHQRWAKKITHRVGFSLVSINVKSFVCCCCTANTSLWPGEFGPPQTPITSLAGFCDALPQDHP